MRTQQLCPKEVKCHDMTAVIRSTEQELTLTITLLTMFQAPPVVLLGDILVCAFQKLPAVHFAGKQGVGMPELAPWILVI